MRNFSIGMRTVALASAVLLWGGGVFAQINHSIEENESNTGQERNMQDRRFVKSAIEGGMNEIQLGQLALQKSSSAQVKQFAQKMIDDHGQMDDHMKPIAQQLGISVPPQLSKKDQKNLAKLSALSGSDFDQAYIKEMVKDHKEDLGNYHDEGSSFKDALNVDPNLKDAVSDGAKIIGEHLQMAEQLAKGQDLGGK